MAICEDLVVQDSLPLLVDTFEPTGDIVPLLQQSIPVTISNLNLNGYADYFLNSIDAHTIQAERKQNGELLGSLNMVEMQLRKQYNKADENILIIEGFIIPSAGGCMTLKRSKDSRFFYQDREYKTSYSAYLTWIYRLDKSGIWVSTTPDLAGTASLLVSIYKNSQKLEHTTLNRYLKEKIYIEEQNPHVLSLMGLHGAGLGEEKAKALIERFGTVWGVLIQNEDTLQEVKGIGEILAHRILHSIGRI